MCFNTISLPKRFDGFECAHQAIVWSVVAGLAEVVCQPNQNIVSCGANLKTERWLECGMACLVISKSWPNSDIPGRGTHSDPSALVDTGQWRGRCGRKQTNHTLTNCIRALAAVIIRVAVVTLPQPSA